MIRLELNPLTNEKTCYLGVLGLAPCHISQNHRSLWHINQQRYKHIERRYVSAGRALMSHPLGAVFVRWGTPREFYPLAYVLGFTTARREESPFGSHSGETQGIASLGRGNILHLYKCFTHTPGNAGGVKKRDIRNRLFGFLKRE